MNTIGFLTYPVKQPAHGNATEMKLKHKQETSESTQLGRLGKEKLFWLFCIISEAMHLDLFIGEKDLCGLTAR